MSTVAPDFEAARCARYRYRYSECRRCADACPHDALALEDKGVALDVAKCRNCALCTAACPTAALTAGNLQRIELLTQVMAEGAGGKAVRIACAPSGLPGAAVVPCLGALDGAVLAYPAKRGVELELAGAAHCERCEHGHTGSAALARHAETRDALEAACDGEPWAALSISDDGTAADAGDFRPGRRGLFRRLVGRGVAEAEKAIARPTELPVDDKAIRPGPWHVPEMRELLRVVGRRADAEPCRLPAAPDLPAADMRLARGCTNCEACMRACPTGALQVRETEDDWTFCFLADRCVGCGVCSEVCQPRVLRPAEAVDLTPGRSVALNVLAKQRCNRCDRFFVSADPQETCAVCCDDENAFARIFG